MKFYQGKIGTRTIAMILILLLLPLWGAIGENATPDFPGVLTLGSFERSVRTLQDRLYDLGYFTGSRDGVFAEDTQQALMAFQQQNGLFADGVCNEETWNLLFSDEAIASNGKTAANTGIASSSSTSYAPASDMAASENVDWSSWNFGGATTNSSSIIGGVAEVQNANEYGLRTESGFLSVKANPLSTFAADAEIGSGHRMTALYELVPVGSAFEVPEVETKYSAAVSNGSEDWLTLRIRAKKPEAEESRLFTYPLAGEATVPGDNLKFAAAVAETAMTLTDSQWKGTADYPSALALLRDCGAVQGDSYKEEFLYLVTLLERMQE